MNTIQKDSSRTNYSQIHPVANSWHFPLELDSACGNLPYGSYLYGWITMKIALIFSTVKVSNWNMNQESIV